VGAEAALSGGPATQSQADRRLPTDAGRTGFLQGPAALRCAAARSQAPAESLLAAAPPLPVDPGLVLGGVMIATRRLDLARLVRPSRAVLHGGQLPRNVAG
jgi:hypothetical protein